MHRTWSETAVYDIEQPINDPSKHCRAHASSQTSNIKSKRQDQIQFAINQPQISQHILLAYEPRWAIGTGSPPSTNEIKSMLSFLKEQTTMPILYGGSVSRDNAKNILTTGVNGLLIGGASLDCNHLLDIIAQYQLV